MSATYQGYYKNGQYFLKDLPQNTPTSKIIVNFLDEAVPDNLIFSKNRAQEQKKALEEFVETIRAIDNEPLGEEFDAIISQRVNITRELDL